MNTTNHMPTEAPTKTVPGVPKSASPETPGNDAAATGGHTDRTNLQHVKGPTLPDDREGFRLAMSWLHTWASLILGWLLFAIFITGTLSLFRTEFNLWMRPELHSLQTADAVVADAGVADKALAALRHKAPDVTQWIMRLPDAREPAVNIVWRDASKGRFENMRVNPQTGEEVSTRETMGGDFFYRFHFELRTAQKGRWAIQGRWIVGAATLLMLIALVTGIVTHRRFFKDFFTFRPSKGGQRAWLDAHNVTGVLVLPFYLMVTFSGLMILHSLYMPWGIGAAYRTDKGVDSSTYFSDLQGEKPERRARRGAGDKTEPLPPVVLQPIVDAAIASWDGGRVGVLQGRRDAQGRAVIQATRHEGDRLQYSPPRLLFDGTTGQWLEQADPSSPAITTYGVLQGLHLARFAGPGMRWVLFGFGLLGSLMIATGMVLWTVKRSAQGHIRLQARLKASVGTHNDATTATGKNNGTGKDKNNGTGTAPQTPALLRAPFGERFVAGINIASLAGLPLACAVYLAANRFLPVAMDERADAELACFFGAWGIALLWALASTVIRPHRWGWTVAMAAAGGVWLALPLINALTTHSHLGVTLPAGEWLWAGMDISFLVTGALLVWLAWRVRPNRVAQHKPNTRHARPNSRPLASLAELATLPTPQKQAAPTQQHSGTVAPPSNLSEA